MHKLWLKFLKENSYDALDYCIKVAKLSNANDIIIGINNLDQFKQIIYLFKREMEEVKLPNFFFDQEILILEHGKIMKLGLIGQSPGNGHPYSWSAILNGFEKTLRKCSLSINKKIFKQY